MEYDSDAVERQYEVMTLRIVHRRRCTGFEESKDFPVRSNDLIAGRYQVRGWGRGVAHDRGDGGSALTRDPITS